MISIHTNLSSYIAQSSLKQSTNILNQAIERMSTGYKINHASDNAANYSISTNMSTQLNSYQVAEDNVATGLDMVMTAQDAISLMQSHASRIHALITQGLNGTYGADSIAAIVSEINTRISEIDRLYTSSEYNGTALFNNQSCEIDDVMPKAGESGFIDESSYNSTVEGFYTNPTEYFDSQIAAMTRVSAISSFTSGQTYSIMDKSDLKKLAELQNSGKSTANVTFVLGADIDLSGEEWTPIGDNNTKTNATKFRGTFNGNGHTISNLNITDADTSYQGLFGYAIGAVIKNVGLKNANVSASANYVGSLAGRIESSSTIENCYAESNVGGMQRVGGLVGQIVSSSINNCHTKSTVKAQDYTGGLIGALSLSVVTNCYTESSVSANTYAGGLIGSIGNASSVENCYSKGSVGAINYAGGITACLNASSVTNSYSTSSVSGVDYIGGLLGLFINDVSASNCYFAGSVYGNAYVGGFCGRSGSSTASNSTASITNCASYGDVYANKDVGSFIGLHVPQNYYTDGYDDDHGSDSLYTSTLTISGSKSVSLNGMNMIGNVGKKMNYSTTESEFVDIDYDLTPLLSQISAIELPTSETTLQVGIKSDDSNRISFDTDLRYNLSAITSGSNINASAYNIIDKFLNSLSKKATQLGAVSNRLESALDSIGVNIENLTSSRSTLRDADIAKESSVFIQQQILQQAAATLLSTANQTPAIALQLI